MKLAVCLVVFSLAVTVVFAAPMEEDGFEVTVQDFLDYFEYEAQNQMVEKRRPKVGPCRSPTGASCQVCNLKITNKKDIRRYLVCGGGGKV